MLQGDNLSVQLFIAAAAISALSIAVTQAGWTHRWFVRGMFVLGALLVIAAVGWRYIEERIPLLDAALQKTASSRAAWFFAGIVPALIAGMLLNDLLHRRRERRIKVRPPGWLSLMFAKEKFARQDLLDRHAYVMEQISDISVASEVLDARVRLLSLAIIGVDVDDEARSQMAEELTRLSEQQRENKEKGDKLIWTQADCDEALRMNIFSQLQHGKLIAKGFLTPHEAGASERLIPTDEWRFLDLIDEDGGKARGPNFEYLALLIGRPDGEIATTEAGRFRGVGVK